MRFLLQNKITSLVCTIVFILFFVIAPVITNADFNQQINYQGKLTDSSGLAVADGTYNMYFWLIASSTAASSTSVWSEVRTGANKVQVTNGLFSVMLGEVTSLASVDFNQTLYLGVEIGGTGSPVWDGEMSPRKVLGAVPAAFEAQNAQTLDNLATTSFLRADDIDTMEATSSSALLTLIQNGAGKIMSLFSGVTEMFTVLNNGNVGIATTTPSEKLTVVGNTYLGGNLSLTGSFSDSVNATGTSGQILSSTGTSTQWKSTSSLGLGDGTFLGLSDTQNSFTANRLIFTNSGATALTDSANLVFDGTNLGIGSTTPGARLAIDNTATTTGSELVTNGTFTGDASGWTLQSGCSVYGSNQVTVTYDAGCQSGADWPVLETTFSTVSGTDYLVTFTISSANAPAYFYLGNTSFISKPVTNGTHTIAFRSTYTGTETIYFEDYNWNTGDTWIIDNVSIKTSASTIRPALAITGYNGKTWLSIGDLLNNTAIGDSALYFNNSGKLNVAIGASALFSNISGFLNTAIGVSSLHSNTSGIKNTAIGSSALSSNTTGSNNTANGHQSLSSNTTGSYNTANGHQSLSSNTTGSYNTALGALSLLYNTAATNTTAIGYQAAAGTGSYQNQGGVYLGYRAGYNASSSSDYNTMIGYQSGYGVTTGANNILLGYNAGYSGTNLTTGSDNIIIGNNIGATSTAMTKGLNIGNLIFGTSLDGTGTTLSTGNIGIGTTTPSHKLTVDGTISVYDRLTLNDTDFNSALGYQAGKNVVSGAQYNTFLGYQAGYSSSTGSTNAADYNTGVGNLVLYSNTTGHMNSALGESSLYSNTTGSYNTAFGVASLYENTTGSYNVANGNTVLYSNTTGSYNVALGDSALYSNTTGDNNYVIGNTALYSNTTGSNNVAIGPAVGDNLTTGSDNIIIGSNIDFASSTGSNQLNIGNLIFGTSLDGTDTTLSSGNIGIGTSTPTHKLTVSGNISVYDRLTLNDTDFNTALGYQAGKNVVSGATRNVFLGYQAGYSSSTASTNLADNNTAIGYQALYSNTTGYQNTAIGSSALYDNTTGLNNTAVGLSVLRYNTIGSYNTSLGQYSLLQNTTGGENTVSGVYALYSNTTGSNNTVSGAHALRRNTAATNTTAIGYNAARGVSDYENQGGVYLGYGAGYSAGNNSNYNTMIGYQSGYGVTTGANNILLGYNAGYSGTNLTTGSDNIIIGNNIGATSTAMTKGLNIGNLIFGTSLDGTGTTLSTGNVGIGTSTPIGRLEVANNTNGGNVSYLSNPNTGTGAYSELNIRNANTSDTYSDGLRLLTLGTGWTTVGAFQQDGSALMTGSNLSGGMSLATLNASANMRFYTGGFADANERMRITSGGLVGIGTTSPVTTLAVNGSTTITSNLQVNGGTLFVDATNNRVGIGTTTPTNQLSIVASANRTPWMSFFDASGNRSVDVYSGTSTASSTGFGLESLQAVTSGYGLTAFGSNALRAVGAGNGHTAVGSSALRSMTGGNNSTAIGSDAGLLMTTGSGNVAIGSTALRGVTNGSHNVGVGFQAMYTLTTGYSNIAIGSYSGKYLADGTTSNTVASSSIYIGRDTLSGSVSGGAVNEIVIGNYLTGNGTNTITIGSSTASTLFAGNLGIGTTTPVSRLAMEKLSYSTAGVAGINQYFTFNNSVASAIQYGNFGYLYATNTATTTIAGNMFKIEDSTLFGNTIRGFEVQTDRGTNTLGENTALSGFARTFGVRGTTQGDAGGTYEPAGVFGETAGTTQGNAIRAYSASITTASLLKLFQASSTFAGTGLLMNFGNSGGSFSSTTASKFIDLQNAGTSMFTVGAYGKLTIGDGTTNNNAGIQVGYGGICVDNDGSCNASTTGRVSAVSYHTGNSDLAEMYFSNESLSTGEVVYIKSGLSVGKANSENKEKIIGVVSTKPGQVLGFDDTSLKVGEKGYPIALAGRVPVRLSNENGAIKAGDELMLSSVPGVVMKASSTGKIIGTALEDFDENRAYSDTYINQFGDDLVDPVFTPFNHDNDPRLNDGCYFGGGNASGDEPCVPLTSLTKDDQIKEAEAIAKREAEERELAKLAKVSSKNVTLENGQQVKIGQIVMFVDLRQRYLDEVGAEMVSAMLAKASTTANEVGEETVWQRVVNLANNFVDGVLSIFTLKADRVEVKEQLCVDGVCLNADDLRRMLDANNSIKIEKEVGGNNDTISPDVEEVNTEDEVTDSVDEIVPDTEEVEMLNQESSSDGDVVESTEEEIVTEVEEPITDTEEVEAETTESATENSEITL